MAIVLTLNAGSSSVKFSVYTQIPAGLEPLAAGQVEGLGAKAHFVVKTAAGERHEHFFEEHSGNADHGVAIRAILDWLHTRYSEQPVVAVGHRVVHGGEEFPKSTLIDHAVIAGIEKCCKLAPLHNPPAIAGIRAAQAVLPEVVQLQRVVYHLHSIAYKVIQLLQPVLQAHAAVYHFACKPCLLSHGIGQRRAAVDYYG